MSEDTMEEHEVEELEASFEDETQEAALADDSYEDDEYVVPGVGAMNAINWFYEHRGHSINDKVGKKLINAIN